MTTLMLELTDELAGELRTLATQEGKPVDLYAVTALVDHARRFSLAHISEPARIAEGSPEEDAALEAALSSPYHSFHPEEAHRKMSLL